MAVGTTTALVLAGLAAAGSAYNTNRTAKKQDAAAAQGISRQAALQAENNANINRTLQFGQQSKPDDFEANRLGQYSQAIRAKLAQANSGLQGSGASSAAFKEAANDAGGQAKGYADTLGGLMAKMDAPTLQRQEESYSYGNLGMDLDRQRSSIQGEDFLTRLRVGGIRRNPYIDAASAAMGGVASAGGGRG
jgi:hypothetical protein